VPRTIVTSSGNRRWDLLATAAISATLALQALGCSSATYASPPPPTGSAVMQWSVAETTNPDACQAHGATTFHVTLYDGVGAFAGEWVQDCSAFATTVEGIDPDDYTGHAELTDSAGNSKTTSVSIRQFTVVGNLSTTVTIDFPADSFY
jgi:hypothetical protein